MTTAELDRHVARELSVLQREFDGLVPPDLVIETGRRHFEALRQTATVTDFIPTIVYRRTREQLRRAVPDELHLLA